MYVYIYMYLIQQLLACCIFCTVWLSGARMQ